MSTVGSVDRSSVVGVLTRKGEAKAVSAAVEDKSSTWAKASSGVGVNGGLLSLREATDSSSPCHIVGGSAIEQDP